MTGAAFRFAIIAALTGTLAGCGTDTDETIAARAFQDVAKSVVSRNRAAGPSAEPGAGLTRAMLATAPVRVDLMTIEGVNATGLVTPLGRNGGVETWTSLDDRTVSLRDGLVVATRGLGPDLIAASVPSLSQVAAGGAWQRVHVTLDGLDQPQRTRFDCSAAPAGPARVVIVERAYDTRLVRETCQSTDGQRFVNEYWFQNGLKLRQSRQWIGQRLGHVAIRRLPD